MAGFATNLSTSSWSSSSPSPFPFASSSSPFSFSSNPSPSPSLFGTPASSNPAFGAPSSSASSTPSFGFAFASSSSSTPSSAAPSHSFGFGASSAAATGSSLFGTSSSATSSPFGGSGLFGSSSSSSSSGTANTTTATLFGSSSTFGTSSIFGTSSASSSSSTTTTSVSSPFSSALFGSSSTSGTFSLNFSSNIFGASSSVTSSSSAAPSFRSLFGSSSSAAPSFPNLTGASSSSSISSSITTPPTSSSAPGFSFLSASSSSSVTSSASSVPSFSFPSAPTSAPSFSFSTSSTLGKSTASISSSGSAPSTTISSAGSSSSPTSSFSFANVTASSGLQSSPGLASNIKAASTIVTTTATTSASTSASKTPSFPAFGVTPSSSTAASTASGSVSSFASASTGATSTGTTSSFLGFQTSPKIIGALTPSSQPQSAAASSLFGVPASTATTSTITTSTAQTSSSLVVSSSSGTSTSVSTAVASASKLPSEITGKTVEEVSNLQIKGNLVNMSDNVPQQSRDEENQDEVSSSTSIKQRSVVWDFFNKLPPGPDGVERASCTACGKVYTANPKSGTSNLKRHIPKCFNTDEPGPPQKRVPLDQAMYRKKLAIAIIKHNYPFTYVEHEATRELHKFLHRDVNFITRNITKADVLKIYEKEKTILKRKLEKVASRICLTSDLWSSITTDGYMTLTAHYVDEKWVLRKKVLNFRVIPPPYSGSLLAEYMINFLTEWGIEKKIFTLTLDNAKYNNGLVDSLRDHLLLNDGLVCDGDFMHVRCGAHVLNLIVQAGLKVIEGAIEKVRESVKYVRGSVARKLKFAECIAQLSLQCGRHVRQDIVTRWNSTYLMLDCALVYRRAYARLQLVDSGFKTCPSQEEWTRVERITRFLKPFHDITTLFSGSSYPTSNLYFQNVWKIQLLIEEEIRNADPLISSMARDMKTKFDKYWEIYSMVLSFAIILDPRYKLKIVDYCFSKLDMEADVRIGKVRDIRNALYKLYEEYEVRSNVCRGSSMSRSSNVVDDGTVDEFDGFESFQSQFERFEREKSQLDMYLEEPILDRKQNIDILYFWRDNQGRYPDLALMARDILSIPITTVASESSFSIGGRIISKYRSSLSSSNAEALLCTRDWLFDIEDEDDTEEERLVEDIEELITTINSINF